jgi:hypothetical protein
VPTTATHTGERGSKRVEARDNLDAERVTAGAGKAPAVENRGGPVSTPQDDYTQPVDPEPAEESGTSEIPGSSEPGTSPQPILGCTLAQYAEATHLDGDWLHDTFRLTDATYANKPAVLVPHADENRKPVAQVKRYCIEATDDGLVFESAKQSKSVPYGLWLLLRARQIGSLTLATIEVDVQTLLRHDIRSLAIARSLPWKGAYDELLAEFTSINVIVAPREEEAILDWFRTSRLRPQIRVVTLAPYPTANALHRALDGDPDRFREHWQAALQAAKSLDVVERAVHEARQAALWEQCRDLGLSPRILDRVGEVLAAHGVVGEERLVRLLYLILASRFLERPVSAAIKGTSSAGKSYTLGRVLRLCPPSAYYELSSMSPRALAYSEEPLQHRYLVLYEAEGLQGDFATYLMRSLLSEGRIRYETVVVTGDGPQPLLIEREGPTGLLTTTTRVELHAENETRMLSLGVTDSTEQTRRVLATLATEGAGVQASAAELDLEPWHAFQTWLEGAEHRVVVPYAPVLADLIPPIAIRLRRDFSMVLSLIRAHAILHQASRKKDDAGRIIADLDDYRVVQELVADLVADRVEAAVPVPIRETVAAVTTLLADKAHKDTEVYDLTASDGDVQGVTVTAVAKVLNLDKSTASRRIEVAIEHGYLRDLETRRGRPRCLVLGEPLPKEIEILPMPETLAKHLG